eukprot:3984695-Lingulodinium_polyedra.AAC.1
MVLCFREYWVRACRVVFHGGTADPQFAWPSLVGDATAVSDEALVEAMSRFKDIALIRGAGGVKI